MVEYGGQGIGIREYRYFYLSHLTIVMAHNLLFYYFRLNFVAKWYDVMNCTTESIIKTRLGLHFFAILNKIVISAIYATYPPLLNIGILVLQSNHIFFQPLTPPVLSFKLKSNHEATVTEDAVTSVSRLTKLQHFTTL